MLRAFLMLCASGAVFGQSSSAPRFEVATVKVSLADATAVSGIKTGHGRLDGSNVTLKRCIIGAYGVGPHQISGGPDWLDTEHYEITAKADQPVYDDAAMMSMLRVLLAERFKLALHRETRTISAYALEVARKGPKLEKAAPGESGTSTSTNNSGVTIAAHNTDMESFTKILARKAELPIVNHTGLDGIFNIELHWASDSARRADGGAAGASLFTAIQEQLGLRLRAQKEPVEFLVIDHAEKPSEN